MLDDERTELKKRVPLRSLINLVGMKSRIRKKSLASNTVNLLSTLIF